MVFIRFLYFLFSLFLNTYRNTFKSSIHTLFSYMDHAGCSHRASDVEMVPFVID